MQRLTKYWQRLSYYLQRRRFDKDLAEEMNNHLEMKITERISAGQDPVAARQAATREFGNQTRLLEKSRAVWGLRFIDTLTQDVNYGFRTLRKNPGFALGCS